MSSSPLTLLSPKSDSLSLNISKSPKEFIYKFLQSDNNLLSPTKRGDLKFIPFIQERDHLGHLISKQNLNKSTISSVSKAPSALSGIQNVKSSEHSPEPKFELKQGAELGYEQFRYLPKIPTSNVKASLKRILKPEKSKSISSPCFLNSERPEVQLNNVPSVGYYEVSDKLLHPSFSGVSFTKQNKPKISISKGEDSTSDDIDIMKSYNRVYQKSLGGTEFNKQTTRDNHFMNKNAEPKPYRDDGNLNDIKINKYSYPKKETGNNDVLFMMKHTLDVPQKNLPLTMPGINDKFSQIKSKYKIFYNKLR